MNNKNMFEDGKTNINENFRKYFLPPNVLPKNFWPPNFGSIFAHMVESIYSQYIYFSYKSNARLAIAFSQLCEPVVLISSKSDTDNIH